MFEPPLVASGMLEMSVTGGERRLARHAGEHAMRDQAFASDS